MERYHHYILKLVKVSADQWDDVQVGKTVYGESFVDIRGSAITALEGLGGEGEYRAYIGRETYDPQWQDYFADERMEHLVISISAGQRQITVLNEGNLVH
jgi:hypothetical protein